MTLHAVLVFAEQITWRLNVKTLAIIQSERNWNRKGSKYRYTLTAYIVLIA